MVEQVTDEEALLMAQAEHGRRRPVAPSSTPVWIQFSIRRRCSGVTTGPYWRRGPWRPPRKLSIAGISFSRSFSAASSPTARRPALRARSPNRGGAYQVVRPIDVGVGHDDP